MPATPKTRPEISSRRVLVYSCSREREILLAIFLAPKRKHLTLSCQCCGSTPVRSDQSLPAPALTGHQSKARNEIFVLRCGHRNVVTLYGYFEFYILLFSVVLGDSELVQTVRWSPTLAQQSLHFFFFELTVESATLQILGVYRRTGQKRDRANGCNKPTATSYKERLFRITGCDVRG